MYWKPPKLWPRRTIFLLGGGPSLATMDLKPIHDQRVIGCNDAYSLGKWVDLCYFGDVDWFKIHWRNTVKRRNGTIHPGLKRFGGLIVGCPGKPPISGSSVLRLQRKPRGIFRGKHYVGWYGNTGASAINLAILLGAKRIVLLGYDMKVASAGEGNWHDNLKNPITKDNMIEGVERMERFKKKFREMRRDLDSVADLDVEILNATPESELEVFPMVDFKDVIREVQAA